MRNFIITHWEHFWRTDTTHWWLHRSAVVAGADSPQHSLFTWTLHKSPLQQAYNISILWRRLRRACANVQTQKNLRFTFYASTSAEISQHQSVVATTCAFILTSVGRWQSNHSRILATLARIEPAWQRYLNMVPTELSRRPKINFNSY